MSRVSASEELTFTFDKAPTGEQVAQLIWDEDLGDWFLSSVEPRLIVPKQGLGLTLQYNTTVWDVKFRKDRT